MNKLTNFLAVASCAAFLANAAMAQTMLKPKDVIGEGGTSASTSNGSLFLQGTVGQSVIGVSNASGATFNQGFWTPGTGAPQVEVARTGPAPAEFSLDQNFPNPYSATTMISFSVPTAQRVVLQVYSMTGMLVKTLVDDQVSSGKYNVTFDASSLSAGMYLYTLQSGGYTMTKRMVVIR